MKSTFPIDNAKTAILDFLSDGEEKPVAEMRDYVVRHANVSPATFYNALKWLRELGKVVRTKPDFYRIVREEKIKGGEQ